MTNLNCWLTIGETFRRNDSIKYERDSAEKIPEGSADGFVERWTRAAVRMTCNANDLESRRRRKMAGIKDVAREAGG
ncbi:hypothetical protein, partial [uncultured Bifidobacterium sp.]|uniref:hypothetical protein n=1 Tax=uncultured Bifidobacterium sp. TaxID=165187 RepID=UPI0027DD61E8